MTVAKSFLDTHGSSLSCMRRDSSTRTPSYLEKILPLRRGTDWEKIVTVNLSWHRDYLEHLVEDPKYQYEYEVQSPELQQKIRQVVNALKARTDSDQT